MWSLSSKAARPQNRWRRRETWSGHTRQHVVRAGGVAELGDRSSMWQVPVEESHAAGRPETGAGRRRRRGRPAAQRVRQLGRHVAQIQVM